MRVTPTCNGNGSPAGLILLDQIRTLDKQRLVRRLGGLDRATLRTALERLQNMFAG